VKEQVNASHRSFALKKTRKPIKPQHRATMLQSTYRRTSLEFRPHMLHSISHLPLLPSSIIDNTFVK